MLTLGIDIMNTIISNQLAINQLAATGTDFALMVIFNKIKTFLPIIWLGGIAIGCFKVKKYLKNKKEN